ncbi:galactose mutarotase-like protein [Irpex lacteus]|nr:galactose mutarotase-like protein [Irpex lacteus]
MSDASFHPIQLTLPSLTPSLVLEVLPYGLTLHRLYVQSRGQTHDILIGPEAPSDHSSQKYVNTIVGRYANRLPVPSDNQGIVVEKNGVQSTMYPRANERETVSLHGGVTGWDSVPWTPLLDPSQIQLFTPKELETIGAELQPPSAVVFTRTSEDGEEGFPGRVRVEVLVALAPPKGNQVEKEETNLGAVVLLYRAKLEEEGKVTPINLTQHWGFNLDASPTSTPSIKDHKLTIRADHTLELDPTFLATGRLAPVEGTHHKHDGKKIGEGFENGYDEFYVFARPPPTIPTRIPASALAGTQTASATGTTKEINIVKDILELRPDEATAPVTLASEKSGLKVVFESNQSGVQFYSNNFASPTASSRKKIHGGSGSSPSASSFAKDGYEPASAAFLEFHEPLAAWLHPETRTNKQEDTLLGVGEVVNSFVRVDVLSRGV